MKKSFGDLLDCVYERETDPAKLATFVEEEFRFKIQPADFVIENFQTVAQMVSYVQGR